MLRESSLFFFAHARISEESLVRNSSAAGRAASAACSHSVAADTVISGIYLSSGETSFRGGHRVAMFWSGLFCQAKRFAANPEDGGVQSEILTTSPDCGASTTLPPPIQMKMWPLWGWVMSPGRRSAGLVIEVPRESS